MSLENISPENVTCAIIGVISDDEQERIQEVLTKISTFLPLKILAKGRRKIKVRVEYCINYFQVSVPLTRHRQKDEKAIFSTEEQAVYEPNRNRRGC